jgi:hypothetical protein
VRSKWRAIGATPRPLVERSVTGCIKGVSDKYSWSSAGVLRETFAFKGVDEIETSIKVPIKREREPKRHAILDKHFRVLRARQSICVGSLAGYK